MPEHCAAYCCQNRRTVQNRARGITFHKFPKDRDVRKKWEVALRREGFTASDSSVLCSEHFKQDDLDRTGQIVRLRDGVIPSIFSFPVHLQRPEKGRTTCTSRRSEESLSVASQDASNTATSHPQPQPNDDHGYALPASPTSLKARLNEALARVESLEREKKNAMAREKRAKTTVKSLLGDLREKNLINEELEERLEFYSDLQIDFMAKQGHEYTKAYREFALTLHLHGPKAYKYLRETQHFPLPHPHTLQRWLCSVDDKPGLNKMMLDMLERRCLEDQAKYGCVALMLDAMAIRKHVQYNPHTQSMSGFVDMGDGNSETDVATEALVFMVVGIQGHWKAPIAYYLMNSLSPVTQRVLLSHALEELHARGIRVAYSPIASTTGQINWRYINYLNDVQKKDGLHAANKITDKHVYYENQKMRVSLAAQTLSRSVSVALRTMRDLGYSQFKHSEATAEFIEMIDRLFDIMNGRNPRAKGFKAPLGALNWMERKECLSRAREYLLTLVTKDGTPLHQSKRSIKIVLVIA
ncbi:DNA transposase THAP9 isoform X1 [Scomber scombrus]|uniref:DNA transposase THAP9 isoform X1 n=1 Tax=Scomber scombrus TaxID=13677 RepID=A0AAV1NL79_SCOSC